MDTWFFYYVRIEQTQEIKPRLSYGWPPMGGEVNEVLQRIAITPEMAMHTLDYLSVKYPLDSRHD